MPVMTELNSIEKALGNEAKHYLEYECKGITKDQLHLPGPDFIDRISVISDRNPQVLRNLAAIQNHGRLGRHRLCFHPSCRSRHRARRRCIICEKTRSTLTAKTSSNWLSKVAATQWLRHLAFWVLWLESTPTRFLSSSKSTTTSSSATLTSTTKSCSATFIKHGKWALLPLEQLFTSAQKNPADRFKKSPHAFHEAHELGMATILWCYLRNNAFKVGDTDYSLAADLTGQANHLGVTIEADIIKQKLPENNGGYNALKFGKTDSRVYSELTTDHPDRPDSLPSS